MNMNIDVNDMLDSLVNKIAVLTRENAYLVAESAALKRKMEEFAKPDEEIK